MLNIERHESEGLWSLRSLPEMDDTEFQRWQRLLEQRTGMNLPPERKTFLRTSLGIRMREIGCAGYEEYYQRVTAQPHGIIEWTVLVDRLTVQETRFYRDAEAFELIRSYVLDLPEERLAGRTLEAWSVGCSTGEEPYTLSMILAESLQQRKGRGYYAVTGTDISGPALEKARRAIYPARKLVVLSEERRDKYFEKRQGNEFRVVAGIRERVGFSRVNVLEIRQAPIANQDIIFCQNLLIYFKRWRRKEILNQLAERLIPGGILVLGLGEIVDWNHPLLERVSSEKTLAYIRRQSTD